MSENIRERANNGEYTPGFGLGDVQRHLKPYGMDLGFIEASQDAREELAPILADFVILQTLPGQTEWPATQKHVVASELKAKIGALQTIRRQNRYFYSHNIHNVLMERAHERAASVPEIRSAQHLVSILGNNEAADAATDVLTALGALKDPEAKVFLAGLLAGNAALKNQTA